ncbi:MAG: hypothetical protein M3Y26_10370, partial [Actinomycetota bacterium]|nr:hypothetical protein [Actinomycetota bacterium]
LAVLPIALLSIPAGSNLLDQLPDVQRRWVADAQGARHAAFAVLVVAVVTLGVLLLGRLRSREMWRRTGVSVENEGLAVLRLGLAAPAVIVLGLVVVALRRGGLPWSMPGLEGLRLALFLAIPIGIIALSALIRQQLQVGQHTNEPDWWRRHFEARPHRVPSDEEKLTTVLAGDIMTAVSIVVAALGLVRSFTAVAALGAVGLKGGSAWAVPALVVGFGLALAGWPLTRWVAARLTDETLVGGVHTDRSPWVKLKATLTPSVQVPARLWLRLGVLVVGVIGTSLLALLAATATSGARRHGERGPLGDGQRLAGRRHPPGPPRPVSDNPTPRPSPTAPPRQRQRQRQQRRRRQRRRRRRRGTRWSTSRSSAQTRCSAQLLP